MAYSRDLGFFEIDPEVRKATEASVDILRDLGAEVIEVEMPWDWDVIDTAMVHLRSLIGASIAPLRDTD